jgi:hypothetical protein
VPVTNLSPLQIDCQHIFYDRWFYWLFYEFVYF